MRWPLLRRLCMMLCAPAPGGHRSLPWFLVYALLGVYATWRAVEGAYFWAPPTVLLSLARCSSPLLALFSGTADLGRSAGLSGYMLLLSQGLLSCLLS